MKKLTTSLIALGLTATVAHSATLLSLSSVMDPSSFISEDVRTGSFARISLGDGSMAGDANDGADGFLGGDQDGLYDLNEIGSSNPTLFGGGLNVFPTETAFSFGSLTYDETQIAPAGTSTFAITSISLDVSPDIDMENWFAFTPTGTYSFGPLDASDTITFEDGVLTGVNLSIDASFNLDSTGIAGATGATVTSTTWTGTLSITGDAISLQIDDTQLVADPFANGFAGGDVLSNFVANLSGTVSSIPEPSGVALVALAVIPATLTRRRRR